MLIRDASRRAISRTTWLAAALLAGSALAGFGVAEAAPLATMTSHVPSVVASHHAAFVAAADPNRVLHLAIALPMRNQAALDALLRQIYDPSSANYKHYLSVVEFTNRFGPFRPTMTPR